MVDELTDLRGIEASAAIEDVYVLDRPWDLGLLGRRAHEDGHRQERAVAGAGYLPRHPELLLDPVELRLPVDDDEPVAVAQVRLQGVAEVPGRSALGEPVAVHVELGQRMADLRS